MRLGYDIGIDFGTSYIRVYVKGKGIVLTEPSAVAVDKNTNRILTVGEEAVKLLGRTPNNIVAIRPFREGVTIDNEIYKAIVKHYIDKACRIGFNKLFKPRVIICIPNNIPIAIKKVLIEVTKQAGVGETYVVEQSIAAAIGAGLDITKASGHMILDIGSGVTDIAVISLGSNVISTSIKIAGDKLNESIQTYIRKKYNITIGERTAEELKISIGTVSPSEKNERMEIRGRDLVSGLPKTVTVLFTDISKAIEEPISDLIEAIKSILERTPPELAADISDNGITIVGGGSLLKGLSKLVSETTELHVKVTQDPMNCVIAGIGEIFNNFEKYKSSIIKPDDFFQNNTIIERRNSVSLNMTNRDSNQETKTIHMAKNTRGNTDTSTRPNRESIIMFNGSRYNMKQFADAYTDGNIEVAVAAAKELMVKQKVKIITDCNYNIEEGTLKDIKTNEKAKGGINDSKLDSNLNRSKTVIEKKEDISRRQDIIEKYNLKGQSEEFIDIFIKGLLSSDPQNANGAVGVRKYEVNESHHSRISFDECLKKNFPLGAEMFSVMADIENVTLEEYTLPLVASYDGSYELNDTLMGAFIMHIKIGNIISNFDIYSLLNKFNWSGDFTEDVIYRLRK